MSTTGKSPSDGAGGGADKDGAPSARLGTFGGVFAPSVLTILGLVLFLRLGYVTGSVGLAPMLAILGLSTMVSVLTTFSLAALATNLKVGGGGVYFLISRTLGPAFGGAIGLVLYLAMSISIAFYAIGLGEAVASIVGVTSPSFPRVVAAGTIIVLLGLAWLGADAATKFQYLVMACLVLAIGGFVFGVIDDLRPSLLADNLMAGRWDSDAFWIAFAIFFPAVTGFTQGVAMSGDLKTPSQSISVGTFSAIGVSTLVYLVAIVALAMAVPVAVLVDDTAIMRTLSLAPWMIDVGVVAATLSSAIASILGAPRTLQRLAADRLVEPLAPFAEGAGPTNNPRRGVLLSAAIALAAVGLGDLDVVAPVISMFFLASYGMINYATFSEARAASTSFRPRFRYFDWRLSLAGTVACLGVIVAISPLAGLAAGAALGWLYRYLSRSVQHTRWADSTSAYAASGLRSQLHNLHAQVDAGRDWRPVTVAFAPRDPTRRRRLVQVAGWLEGGVGFTTVARVVAGTGAMTRKTAGRIDLELQRELASADRVTYGRVLAAETLEAGVGAMLQAHGMGALRANLALSSWFEGADDGGGNGVGRDAAAVARSARSLASTVQTAIRHGCNAGIVSTPDRGWDRIDDARQTIVVWWPDDHTGKLLTMLAWLCTRQAPWVDANIEVWVEVDVEDSGRVEARRRVAKLISDARLPAKVAGVGGPGDFLAANRRAGLTLAPVRVRHGEPLGPGGQPLVSLIGELGLAIFAHAASPVELDVQPDETDLAAVAAAHERATALSARAEELSQKAATLLVSAELMQIDAESGVPVDPAVVTKAQAEARSAQRTYVDARTRADQAWRVVQELDPLGATDTPKPQDWIGAASRPDGSPTGGLGRE